MQSSAVMPSHSSVFSVSSEHDPDAPVSDVLAVAKSYTGWYRGSYGEMVEGTTGDIYNDDTTQTVRLKCAALAVGNPFVNAVNLGQTMWGRTRQACRDLKHGRIKHGMGHLGMAAASPALWASMEGAALVGMVAPLHGRKWWGRVEQHMAWQLAPCFQPLLRGGMQPMTPEELKERGYKQHLMGIQVGATRW